MTGWQEIHYEQAYERYMLLEGTNDGYKYTKVFVNAFTAQMYSKIHKIDQYKPGEMRKERKERK